MFLAITVVIPTYNRAHMVPRAIASVLKQIQPRDRLIVVDDGSTDSTEEVLKPLLPRITYVRTQNAGAGAARNVGVREAKTPLVAFLDSDDEWLAGKLELQRALMEARSDVLFCFSDFAEVIHDEIVHSYLRYWDPSPLSWQEILGEGVPYSSMAPLPNGFQDFPVHIGSLFSHMINAQYVLTDSVVVRREEAGEALYFDEDIPYWEDYLCFTRLSLRGNAAFLSTETALQYDHDARLSRAPELVYINATITALERRWNLDPQFLEKHRDRYLLARDKLRRHKAAFLISLGQTKQARAELRLIRSVPFRYKFASTLPGPMARALFKAFKMAKTVRTNH